jgi:nickel/cobalt transporter (NicO) family protein
MVGYSQMHLRVLAFACVALSGVALAQGAAEPGVWTRFLFWVTEQQNAFYQALRGALRGLKDGEAGALAAFLGLCFGYGVFHAAGPGHGKAIIASYLAGTRDSIARGLALSVVSSMAQAVTAVVLVGVLAVALDLAHRAVMAEAVWIERVSFVMAVLVGLWLAGSALYEAVTGRHVHLFHHHGTEHVQDDHHHHHHHGGHHHQHDHGHDDASHSHIHAGPVKTPFWSWSSAGLIAAIGLRPCAGAIIVLLFSLTLGIFWAGVAAAFAMAAGTAITVASIALLTVVARQSALAAAGRKSRIRRSLFLLARVAGGLLLVFIGVTLLMAPAVTTPFGAMPGT